jgi:excisionase family DNA binding protein
MAPKPRRYTVKEAAYELDVTEQTVRSYLKDGDLKGNQVGKKRKWAIPAAEIAKFKKRYGYEET